IRQAPVGPGKAERTVIFHEGGIPGFNTIIVRVPEGRQLVVLLNNTGDARLEAISDGILDILNERVPPAPRRSIAEELAATIASRGIEAAVKQYGALRQDHPDHFEVEESHLNALGYQLLAGGKVDAAIAIFRLNAEQFPDSWNVYDSLGEALAAAGQKEEAIKCYAKSLELNPENRGGAAALERLRKP
ncbi:MAG TPA: tetratricopeptide repeat protein, partial [Thermoanaerobaculaceae bacterium]|nr:tetratricopeptide repeat protein [Thermoanaerobaculaceae bacterium]